MTKINFSHLSIRKKVQNIPKLITAGMIKFSIAAFCAYNCCELLVLNVE